MAGPKYTQENEKFLSFYHLNFNIANYQVYQAKKSYMNDNIFEKDPTKEKIKIYVNTLTAALKAHHDNKLKISGGINNYYANGVDIADFINDFDKVIQAQYEDGLNPGDANERKPYENIPYNSLIKIVWGRVKHYNAPLSSVWANTVLNGDASYERLKEETDDIINTIDSAIKEGTTEDLAEENKKDLANIILAKQAMDKVSEKRTWGWRLSHLLTWIREASYRRQLTKKINEYKKHNIPLEEAVDESLKEPMLESVYERIKSHLPAQNVPEEAVAAENVIENENVIDNNNVIDNENVIEEPKENIDLSAFENKPEAVFKVSDRQSSNEVLFNNQVHENFKNQLKAIFKEFGIDEAAASSAFSTLTLNSSLMNSMFFNMPTDAMKEVQIANFATAMVTGVYGIIDKGHPEMNKADKLAAAQMAADVALNIYTVVTSDAKYQVWGENYFVKNASDAELAKLLGSDELVAAVKEELQAKINNRRVNAAIDNIQQVLKKNEPSKENNSSQVSISGNNANKDEEPNKARNDFDSVSDDDDKENDLNESRSSISSDDDDKENDLDNSRDSDDSDDDSVDDEYDNSKKIGFIDEEKNTLRNQLASRLQSDLDEGFATKYGNLLYSDQLEKKMNLQNYTKITTDTVGEILEAKFGRMYALLNKFTITADAIQIAKDSNSHVDSQMNAADKHKVMAETAGKIFKDIVSKFNEEKKNESTADKFVAAQLITDAVMNAFSPSGLNEKEFGKYGDCFIAKDPETIKRFIAELDEPCRFDDDAIEEVISTVNKELGLNKEKVNFGSDLDDLAPQKSGKVPEISSINKNKIIE